MSKNDPWKFDSSPLYACGVTDWCTCPEISGKHRHVIHSMAFDPVYGPEDEEQIKWHRRQHNARFVQGWKVGLPLPRHFWPKGETAADHATWQREVGHPTYFAEENLRDVVCKPEWGKSTALESGISRNESVGTTATLSPPFVTDACGSCGLTLPAKKGGRKRRDGARYCSNACKQRAYRSRDRR